MPGSAQSMDAADLVVHGTFDLRRALDLLAQPARHPALTETWLETVEVRCDAEVSARASHRIDRRVGSPPDNGPPGAANQLH